MAVTWTAKAGGVVKWESGVNRHVWVTEGERLVEVDSILDNWRGLLAGWLAGC